MLFKHRAEWEWGWKTPLLLRLESALHAGESPIPSEIRDFLETPLSSLALADAERILETRIAELRTYRIGVYFERVQEALFLAHPGTRSLRTSLIVPGRTEIDLLHRIHSLPGTVIHWEVAVKYYLGLDAMGSTDAHRYVGPSLKDTLGVKMRTIYNRQLPILTEPAIREKLGASFGIEPDEKILRMPKVQGLLYAPFRGLNELRRPAEVLPGTAGGAWCSHGELTEFLASAASTAQTGARIRWMRDRYDWLRESRLLERPEDEAELKDYLKSSLKERWDRHFQDSTEPIHATILDAEKELRFFIVADGWGEEAERKLETLRAGSRIKE